MESEGAATDQPDSSNNTRKRVTWGKRGAGSLEEPEPGDAAVPAIWQFFRAEAPEDSMDPLAATDTLQVMPEVPKMLRDMDTTVMEEPLRKLINAPDLSHAGESAVAVKTWAKDDVVEWPEEAVRRTCLKRIRDSGLSVNLPGTASFPGAQTRLR